MKSFVALAVLLALILAACSSADKNSVSNSSPTPIAAAPTPAATPCSVDASDDTPCPGTPEPLMHQPLPPPGPISDSDIGKHLPAGLSVGDRMIIEKVMMAKNAEDRQYVRWVYCKGHIFVFKVTGVVGRFSAAQVLNDDPRPKNDGGDYVNVHTCVDFPMPGA